MYRAMRCRFFVCMTTPDPNVPDVDLLNMMCATANDLNVPGVKVQIFVCVTHK